jgi:hypothetical protein
VSRAPRERVFCAASLSGRSEPLAMSGKDYLWSQQALETARCRASLFSQMPLNLGNTSRELHDVYALTPGIYSLFIREHIFAKTFWTNVVDEAKQFRFFNFPEYTDEK